MTLTELRDKVHVNWARYGQYNVTIKYHGKTYHCTSHNSLAYDFMNWEPGDPRGHYTSKQALMVFWNECKRANHLGEYKY